ncbi:hypothetical protein [Patulibacter americanus]|uniref:hypothetical protein n=1 Tax=Patulibacter americanus TaxID=588672 RepID=UPI0003B60802|nr:hypothetical protein [Patulibacter americanus]
MRRSSHPITIAAVLVALTAGAPAVASATSPAVQSIYEDCEDGTLDKRYSDAQLSAAMRDIEANTGEYSECSDAIYAAQLGLTGAAGKAAKAARDAAGGTPGKGGDTAKDGATTDGGAAGDPAGAGAAAPAADPTDGRGASDAEKAAAAAAATAAADAPASRGAATLLGAAVPAAAVEMGATRIAMPLPAVIAVGVCALLGVLAGVATLVTRLTRPRL